MTMKRRDFLRCALLSSISLGIASLPRRARADVPVNDKRVILFLMLQGGPDFRHLIVPPFSADPATYGSTYWRNRWRAHHIGSSEADWQARWENDYLPTASGPNSFGILKKCGFLKTHFDAGKVAIINNTLGSTTRDHAHSEIVFESGDRTAGPNDRTRDGWGGRLAQAVGGGVVSLHGDVRLFCNGKHPTDPALHDNSQVVGARNTRSMALFRPDSLVDNPAAGDPQAVLSRALESYYQAKRQELPQTSPFRVFAQHEQTLRAFGDAVNARLASEPLPAELEALYDPEGSNALSSRWFGEQMRNAFDAFVCSDILGFRVGALHYGGWDSHRDQMASIEPRLEDIFGTGKGLDTLLAALQSRMPDAYANCTIVIGGEFGRQLRDNGDNGTDHGRGNSIIVIGDSIQGGIYGDLFPQAEIPLFDEPSKDITGLTAIEQVFAAACNWMDPGAGAKVFPDLSKAPVEDGVALNAVFS